MCSALFQSIEACGIKRKRRSLGLAVTALWPTMRKRDSSLWPMVAPRRGLRAMGSEGVAALVACLAWALMADFFLDGRTVGVELVCVAEGCLVLGAEFGVTSASNSH